MALLVRIRLLSMHRTQISSSALSELSWLIPFLGEITPAMATAIGISKAYKILIPVNRCNHYVVGCQNSTLSDYINMVCDEVGKEAGINENH